MARLSRHRAFAQRVRQTASTRHRAVAALAAVCATVFVGGCGGPTSAQPSESGTQQSPTAANSAAPTTVEPIVPTQPRATLAAPPAPPAGADAATASPKTYGQYVPPDITQSGIALAVSSTIYSPGQKVEISGQAAPELAGFTSHVLLLTNTGAVISVASGTVDEAGRFTLSFQPQGSPRVVATVAQAGVTNQPSHINEVAARSAVVRIQPS